jgi:hypothetical protein
MPLRLVIFSSDGRAARNVTLGPLKLALLTLSLLAAISVVLWLGWTIGELTAQI